MSQHYPASPPLSQPPLDWSDAVGQARTFETDLYWVSEGLDESPEWLPELEPLELEAKDGRPEGRLLGEGELFRPVYHHHNKAGDWWVQDGATGEVLAGRLRADQRAARKRLGFLTGLSIILAFLGGSIVIGLAVALASGLGVRTAMRGGNAGFAPILGLFLGGMAVYWVVARLAHALPPVLQEAVDRVESEQISLPGDQRWRAVFASFGLLLVVLTLFGLLTSLFTRDPRVLLVGLLQTGLGGWLAWRFLREGKGYSLNGLGQAELKGDSGELVLLAVRVGLFALAGTGLASVAQGALGLPLDPTAVATRGGEAGAILAVIASRPKDGLALVVGLIVKLVGDVFLGPWVALALAALTVAGMARGGGRNALKRAWGFSIGLVFGRLVGRALGLFFLGTGGIAVGEILAEQLAATVGWKVAGDEAEQATPPPASDAALPEGSDAASED